MPTEMRKLPINPKRIAQVRAIEMLDAEDWPDDMSREKLEHFCLLTGFPIGFMRQGDPPEMKIHWCYTRDLELVDIDEGIFGEGGAGAE